jgi:hypothetical protein
MNNDIINATFELLGSLFVLNHCRVLLNAKSSAGVSSISLAYFLSWGFWNIYYYPSLGQNFSFYAGIALAVANLLYLGLVIKFRGEK